MRINVGCGSTPTEGWTNFDNSLMVRLVKIPGLVTALSRAHVLGQHQLVFARVAREANISWANAARRLPVPSSAAEAIYSSHMLEHLDRREALRCLGEFHRVLTFGGILRIAVPDIERLARRYLESLDADRFIESTLLAQDRPTGVLGLLRALVVGPRHHMWMYDARSLVRLLESCGFSEVRAVPPGESAIPNPGALDLHERADETIFVEAAKKP